MKWNEMSVLALNKKIKNSIYTSFLLKSLKTSLMIGNCFLLAVYCSFRSVGRICSLTTWLVKKGLSLEKWWMESRSWLGCWHFKVGWCIKNFPSGYIKPDLQSHVCFHLNGSCDWLWEPMQWLWKQTCVQSSKNVTVVAQWCYNVFFKNITF